MHDNRKTINTLVEYRVEQHIFGEAWTLVDSSWHAYEMFLLLKKLRDDNLLSRYRLIRRLVTDEILSEH